MWYEICLRICFHISFGLFGMDHVNQEGGYEGKEESSNFQLMFYAHIKVLSIEPEAMLCQEVV